MECSGRGICDYSSGHCTCYTGYRTSNGFGLSGSRGDCGYKYTPGLDSNYTQTNNTVLLHHMNNTISTSCPFYNNSICSNHGVCNELIGTCICDSGYGGSSCFNKTCLSTPTWFGDIGLLGHLGTQSVCGGVGQCNGLTGVCYNCGGSNNIFQGTKCESMSCYNVNGTSDGLCNGNGACLTLRELALLSYNDEKVLSNFVYTTPWDADMIRGCACSRAVSIDNQYDQIYLNQYQPLSSCLTSLNQTTNTTVCGQNVDKLTSYYRGPYPYSATDFTSYNCGRAKCPHGDDPRATRGVNEIQKINCGAINGTFQLTFRENTTLPIAFNATSAILKASLEQIFTIREVSVTIFNGIIDSVCTQNALQSFLIEFKTEFGKLPLLKSVTTLLPHSAFNITEYQKSTKKDIECSGVGICDDVLGRCSCKKGYMSSNSSVYAPGLTGDCTYFNPFYTQISIVQN